MEKPTYILVKLKNNCGCYLTVSETKDLIDILKKEVDKSWEQEEQDKKTHDYLAEFEKSDRQFPDELFLPKQELVHCSSCKQDVPKGYCSFANCRL